MADVKHAPAVLFGLTLALTALSTAQIAPVVTQISSAPNQDHPTFWRLECQSSIALGRIDPLMSYGSPSEHVHSVKGASALSTTSTNASLLLNSTCSSCGVRQDASLYWTPALYFMHDNGTLQVVEEKPPHKSYYTAQTGQRYDGEDQAIEPFPNGFAMIAGSNYNRNSSIPKPDPNPGGPWSDESQDLRAERAIGFNCLNYKATPEGSLVRNFMPNKTFLDANCPDGLRLELAFPSCWNGNVDGGPSHNSHVAYPDLVRAGVCPEGFDRRLPYLFYETIVATDSFKDQDGQFVFANGDPTGYGYHGDFVAAWQGDTLATALETCTDESGDMRSCPAFTINTNTECDLDTPLPSAIAHEDAAGPIPALLNGLSIAYGPAPASKPAELSPPAAATESVPSGQLSVSSLVPSSTSAAEVPASSSSPSTPANLDISPNAVSVNEKLAVHALPPSEFAPTATAAASSTIADINEKLVAASSIPATITPIPINISPSAGQQPGEAILTTSYEASGQEVIVEQNVDYVAPPEVTVTAYEPGKTKRGAAAPGSGLRNRMAKEHLKRHALRVRRSN